MSSVRICAILAIFLATVAIAVADELPNSGTQVSKPVADQLTPLGRACTTYGCKVVYEGQFKSCEIPTPLGQESRCPPVDSSCTCTLPDGRVITGKVY